MFSKYLLTGATGFLGNTIAWMLHEKGLECVCLVVKGDRYASKLPPSVKIVYGDVLDFESISEFFEEKDDNTCLLHCAGIVSIASKSVFCVPLFSVFPNSESCPDISESLFFAILKPQILHNPVHSKTSLALPPLTATVQQLP